MGDLIGTRSRIICAHSVCVLHSRCRRRLEVFLGEGNFVSESHTARPHVIAFSFLFLFLFFKTNLRISAPATAHSLQDRGK